MIKYLDNLVKEIEVPINYNKKIYNISASYGISAYGEDGYEINELIIKADHRMYEHKKSKIILSFWHLGCYVRTFGYPNEFY